MATGDPKRVSGQTGTGIGAIADILQLFGGNKQTQQTSADTGPLRALLGQVQGQQNYDQLLQSIFQQASGQMPGLQARYSNAIGARSGGNSAVQAGLNDLLKQTTLAGTQAVINAQNQNNALQAQLAGQIADSSRRVTSGSGTNLGKAATILGGLQVLGKTGVTQKVSDFFTGLGGDAGGGTVPVFGAASDPMFFTGDSGPAISSAVSSASLPDFGDIGSGIADFGSGIYDAAAGAIDGIGNWFSGMGAIGSDGGSTASDFSDIFNFADGGLVGRDGEKEEAQKFADGGEVTVRSGGGRRSSAPSYTPDPIQQSTALNAIIGAALNPPRTPAPGNYAPLEVQELTGGSAQDAASANTGNMSVGQGLANALGFAMNPVGFTVAQVAEAAAQQAQAQNPAAVGQAAKGLAGLAQTGGKLGPVAALSLAKSLAQVLGLGQDDDATGFSTGGMSTSQAAQAGSVAQAVAQDLGLTLSTNAMSVNPATAQGLLGQLGLSGNANSVSDGAGLSISPGEGLGLGASTGSGNGISIGDVGLGISIGGDSGGEGLGGVGIGEGIGMGNAGGIGEGIGSSIGEGLGIGGDYANGGHVKGPGTGTSDSIPARLSDGEYVIPADVVDRLGVEFFDNLRKQFHQMTGSK